MQRDAHRRITGYTAESEWDETERAWMLALEKYEQTLCPLCGLPRDICHDPRGETAMHADAEICWTTVHRQMAVKKLRDADPKAIWNDALTTKLTLQP